jgi:hypothetical protein
MNERISEEGALGLVPTTRLLKANEKLEKRRGRTCRPIGFTNQRTMYVIPAKHPSPKPDEASIRWMVGLNRSPSILYLIATD